MSEDGDKAYVLAWSPDAARWRPVVTFSGVGMIDCGPGISLRAEPATSLYCLTPMLLLRKHLPDGTVVPLSTFPEENNVSGPTLRVIGRDPTVVYRKNYRSEDGGLTWRLRLGTERSPSWGTDTDGLRVYSSSGSEGVVFSTDGGDTWDLRRDADGNLADYAALGRGCASIKSRNVYWRRPGSLWAHGEDCTRKGHTLSDFSAPIYTFLPERRWRLAPTSFVPPAHNNIPRVPYPGVRPGEVLYWAADRDDATDQPMLIAGGDHLPTLTWRFPSDTDTQPVVDILRAADGWVVFFRDRIFVAHDGTFDAFPIERGLPWFRHGCFAPQIVDVQVSPETGQWLIAVVHRRIPCSYPTPMRRDAAE